MSAQWVSGIDFFLPLLLMVLMLRQDIPTSRLPGYRSRRSLATEMPSGLGLRFVGRPGKSSKLFKKNRPRSRGTHCRSISVPRRHFSAGVVQRTNSISGKDLLKMDTNLSSHSTTSLLIFPRAIGKSWLYINCSPMPSAPRIKSVRSSL